MTQEDLWVFEITPNVSLQVGRIGHRVLPSLAMSMKGRKRAILASFHGEEEKGAFVSAMNALVDQIQQAVDWTLSHPNETKATYDDQDRTDGPAGPTAQGDGADERPGDEQGSGESGD
jgi:hypothetical protein